MVTLDKHLLVPEAKVILFLFHICNLNASVDQKQLNFPSLHNIKENSSIQSFVAAYSALCHSPACSLLDT